MRWLGVLALLGACGGTHALPPSDLALELDVEEGTALAPSGATSVELILHERSSDGQLHDVVLSTDLTRDPANPERSTFDFTGIDPTASVSIEATLRNDSGAAVGYGRTDVAAALAAGADIVVKVRRPIVYIAGQVSKPPPGNPNGALHWTEAPATFSDLSSGAPLDGRATVGSKMVGTGVVNPVMMIGAGPNLYMIAQATSDPGGALTGAAQVMPIATGDHQVGAALPAMMTGGVGDGAGADDGTTLVIGTTMQLFVVDATAGTATPLADGNFSRVAIVATTDDANHRTLAAIAIKNRGSTTGACATTAELWWAPLVAGAPSTPAHLVATGGFSDIATDRGQAYYLDACKGEIGRVTEASTAMLRSIPGTGPGAGATAGKPTALAVSNGQAYVGVETPQLSTTVPAATSLLVMPVDASSATVRTLWSEGAQQVLDVIGLTEVRRQMNASSVVFNHLEIGAGGDYVALTTRAHFHGAEIAEAGFPDITMDAEELRVFAAASGGAVQRYRSWCDGVVLPANGFDFMNWECAAAVGQTAAAADALEHHIGSMTFLFGKK
jgi:hypothetical protein